MNSVWRQARGAIRRLARNVDGAILIALMAVAPPAAPLIAQRVATTDDPSRTGDTRAAEAMLSKVIDARIDRLSLPLAIKTLAARAAATVVYRPDILAHYTASVSVQGSRTSFGMALRRVLEGTSLKIIPLDDGRIAIVEDADGDRSTLEGGIVTGHVTDAKTKRPVVGASVVLDDSIHGTQTNSEGQYRLANVPAGEHRVMVRSVGYARQNRRVVVANDQIATLDFVLESSVNMLDQIVVTATGAQRYRELGHVVTVLNADSLVKSAPITTMAQLLTARVPGLQVMTGNGGLAGGEVALQIRGQSTLNLDPQPIVIIDGIRYKNTNGIVDENGGSGSAVIEDSRPFGATPRSPLNDLNVNDIETIEVVKGPSASTLYGPDAASGVIVITTKRGQVGKPKWNFYLHPNLSTLTAGGAASRPVTGYWGWGHDPSSGEPFYSSCTLISQYYQACVLDSITVAPTLASEPDLTVISKNRPQWQSGLSVTGGADMFRYFFSGGYDSQVGSLRIPDAAAQILIDRLGKDALTNAIRDPNTQQVASLRSNLTADVSPQISLGLNAAYTRSVQRQISISAYENTVTTSVLRPGCPIVDPNSPCTSDQSGAFIQSTAMNGNRLDGTVTGTARPLPWLSATGSFGLDLDQTIDRGVDPQNGAYDGDGGSAQDFRRSNTERTGRVNATARAHPSRFSFQTTLGADYHYIQLDGVDLNGFDLAPGSQSIATASYQYTTQLWNEMASLGTYGEEVFGINDRLFLTGAIRFDGSTSFGDAYHPRPFPKIGASWIASDEPFLKRVPGLNQLRFRYAFGASSRYPTSGMKNGHIAPQQTVINDQTQNWYERDFLANPLLRPERTRESEYGADATILGEKVDIGMTWYRKRVKDLLQAVIDPQGIPSQWGNVGDVASHGWEATMNVRLVETSALQANIRLTGNFGTDKLLSLSTGTTRTACGYACFKVGLPLGAILDRTILGVQDTVGGQQDSIVLPQEIVFGPLQYIGVTTPTHTYTLTPMMSFLGGRVRLSTLIDRSTGFVVPNPYGMTTGLNIASLVKTAPLVTQAYSLTGCCQYAPGDFTRWRELSLSADLPHGLMRWALLSRGTVSFYVRNLALWTRDTGGDPESIQGQGTVGIGGVGDVPGIAQPRSWSISFDFTP